MNYIEFHKKLSPLQVFSTRDIEKSYPKFDSRRLYEWQSKGYIQKIINRFYIFSDIPLDEKALFKVANKIYGPSYISLETAFYWYGLIPEMVYTQTSVSTSKTVSFSTPIGNFSYQKIKPSLFWGYRLIEYQKHPIKIADPEKAVLDFLYLSPNLRSEKDFQSLRFNTLAIHEIFNKQRFEQYCRAFNSPILTKRAKEFIKIIDYVDH